MLVRCRRNDGVKGRTESRWRFKRPPATLGLLIHFVHGAHRFQYYDCAAVCSTGRGARELSTALKICWTLSAPSNRIDGKFRQGGIRRAGARIQGARAFPGQCCTRRRCALATDRRTFVLSPRGRRWLTYSFSARARHADFNGSAERVGSAQESSSRAYSAAVPSLRSNAYVGRPGCMDRPHAAVGRSATAQWCSRGGLECIGQRWRGHAKKAWREEISSSRGRLSKSWNWRAKADRRSLAARLASQAQITTVGTPTRPRPLKLALVLQPARTPTA